MTNRLAILFCLYLILSFSFSFAQKSKHSIAIEIGPALPLGDFASTDGNSMNSEGAANLGVSTALTFSRLISTNISLLGSYSFALNPVDDAIVSKTSLLPTGSGGSASLTVKPWFAHAIMGGFRYDLPLSSVVCLNFTELVGLNFVKSNGIDADLYIPNMGSMQLDDPGKVKASLSLAVGTGMTFMVDKKTYLKIGADYQFSRPRYTIDTFDTYGDDIVSTLSQSVSILSARLGLVFNL